MKISSKTGISRRGKIASTVIFPIAPQPFNDESPISWVQRLCGEHHCSYVALGKLLRKLPPNHDWDTSCSAEAWIELCQLADQKSIACSIAIWGYQALFSAVGHDLWPLRQQKYPSYKWCTECWRDDSVPYLRWTWRLERVRTCSIHYTELVKRCPWCDSPMALTRALLTTSGAFAGVPNLSFCGKCALPMADTSVGVGSQIKRTLREFFGDSWCYLHEESLKIQAKISILRAQLALEKIQTWQSIEELDLLKKKLIRTQKSAQLFLEQFMSDKGVPL